MYLSQLPNVFAEMQKAASTSSMLVLFFITNCVNVWAVDAQRLCNCYFFKYQHTQLVQLCYFLGFAMAQLVQASTVWRYVINTDGTKALSQNKTLKQFLGGSNKKLRYFVANLKLDHSRIICANFLGPKIVLIYTLFATLTDMFPRSLDL